MIAARVAIALGKPQRVGKAGAAGARHGGHSVVLRDGRESRLLIRGWGGGCDPRDILAEPSRRRQLGAGREAIRSHRPVVPPPLRRPQSAPTAVGPGRAT